MPPIPTELMRHNKTSLRAISRLMHRSKNPSFDYLIGAHEQRGWQLNQATRRKTASWVWRAVLVLPAPKMPGKSWVFLPW
jgi:hypothetical protein